MLIPNFHKEMKRYLFVKASCLFAAALVAGSITTGCYDDTTLSEKVKNVEDKTTNLEKRLTAVEELAKALENKDHVTGVKALGDDSGYVISFQKSGDVTIKNGVNGKNGEDGKDGKDAVIGIDQTNPAYVVLTFVDGTVVTLPKYVEKGVKADTEGLVVRSCEEEGTATEVKVPVSFIGFAEDEFSGATAVLTSAGGIDIALVTRADASSAWGVELSAVEFSGNAGSCTATVTVPAMLEVGEAAMLRITAVDKGGNEYSTSCFLKVASTYKSYEMRVLTFEGEKWTALIDTPQYGGPILYGNGSSWADSEGTMLGGGCDAQDYSMYLYGYSDGGYAISNYVDGNLANGTYENQLAIYKAGASAGRTAGGNDGSDNFCVYYAGYGMSEENLNFTDNVARIIDHMYVNNTLYTYNSLVNGDSFAAPVAADGFFKIVATGYDASEKVTGKAEFYLAKDGKVVDTWTKWDLTSLGKVVSVIFTVEGSAELYGDWGLNTPAYFALDDVAVRFTVE